MDQPDPISADSGWAAIEARLRRWRIGYLLAALIAADIWKSPMASAAVLAGGVLSLLHLKWIEREVDRRLLAKETSRPRGFLWRLLLSAAVIYAIFRLHWLPLIAVLAGLFTPAAAICFEGIWQLVEFVRHRQEPDSTQSPRSVP